MSKPNQPHFVTDGHDLELLRQIVENAPQGVAIFDKFMRYLMVSKRYISDFHLENTTLIGRSHYEVFPEIPERWKAIHQSCLDGATLSSERDPFIRSDGSIEWIRWEVQPWMDTQGNIGGIIIFYELITQQTNTELKLRESENKFSAMFHMAPIPAALLQRNNQILCDINDSWRELFGYRTEDMLGRSANEFGIRTATGKPKTVLPATYEIATRSGKTVTVIENRTGISINNQDYELVFLQNIDQLLDIENRFHQYEHIISSTNDLIALLDKNCCYLAVNSAYMDAFGKTHGPLIGKSVGDIFGQAFFEKIMKTKIDRALAGENVHYREWFELPDSGRKYMDVAYSPYYGIQRDIRGFVVTARDITEQESLQSQLLQAQKLESIGRLAGGIAHDYNNMLGIIIGYAELALDKLTPDQPLHKYLIDILSAANRTKNITRQLLAFARKQPVKPQVIDLNEVVSGMLKMLHRLIGEDIDLAWQPGAQLWPIEIDPSQIEQILANLSINARDAICDVGKLSIRTDNITLDQVQCNQNPDCKPGDYVVLSLEDTGCGMTQETLRNIFDPFFTTKNQHEGTGLGLATVHGIVQQNRGCILVDSQPGLGSHFRIYFPRFNGAPHFAAPDNTTSITQGRGETVLLVEDDTAVREMSQIMLESLGYAVLSAGSPGEALKLAGQHPDKIKLLITDIIMPEMNGQHLAKQIRALSPNIRTLYMSGYTASELTQRGISEDNAQFIQKPFSMKDLASRVSEALHTPGVS